MAEAGSLIGATMTLTSKSAIRYRGTLQEIDTEGQRIVLLNVRSLGTEDRRPPHLTVPPSDSIYEHVVFKASDVLDLAIEPTAPPPPVEPSFPNDPAIMSYGSAAPPATSPIRTVQPLHQPPPRPTSSSAQTMSREASNHSHSQTAGPSTTSSTSPVKQQPVVLLPGMRGAPATKSAVGNFDTTINRVKGAIGELNADNNARPVPSGNAANLSSTARGLPGALSAKAPPVPKEAFDFEEMNKKFEKIKKEMIPNPKSPPKAAGGLVEADDDSDESDSDDSSSEEEQEEQPVAYNKSRSFFDSVSSDVQLATQPGGGGRGGFGGGRGRGGGGGGGYRWRREDEAAANMSTFGEVGGNDFGRGGYGGRGRGGPAGGGGGAFGGRGRGRGQGFRGGFGNGRPAQ